MNGAAPDGEEAVPSPHGQGAQRLGVPPRRHLQHLGEQRRAGEKKSGGGGGGSSGSERAAAGNEGQVGHYLEDPEITPPIARTGRHRFRFASVLDEATRQPRFPRPDAMRPMERPFGDPSAEVRAAVEGRFLSMRSHAKALGIPPPASVLVTGGGSQSASILQVIADVFGAVVHVERQPDAASFGAALRAAHGQRCHESGRLVSFPDLSRAAFHRTEAARPDAEAHALYTALLPRFDETEALLARA